MLQAFAAAFRTPDLRRKLLFSLAMIAIYRLGASVPGPGVSCATQDGQQTTPGTLVGPRGHPCLRCASCCPRRH